MIKKVYYNDNNRKNTDPLILTVEFTLKNRPAAKRLADIKQEFGKKFLYFIGNGFKRNFNFFYLVNSFIIQIEYYHLAGRCLDTNFAKSDAKQIIIQLEKFFTGI